MIEAESGATTPVRMLFWLRRYVLPAAAFWAAVTHVRGGLSSGRRFSSIYVRLRVGGNTHGTPARGLSVPGQLSGFSGDCGCGGRAWTVQGASRARGCLSSLNSVLAHRGNLRRGLCH